jgi:hypothetical protein
LEFPAFVRMTLKTLFFPTATFPKLKLDALVARTAVAAIPIPLKDTVLGEPETSLMTETLPDKAPGAFGEKTTSNVDCFPAPIVRGSEIPVIVTPAAVALACVTVRFDPPAFVIVTDWEAVPPTATEPKLIDAGATEIVAAPGVVCWLDEVLGVLAIPVQPEMHRMAKSGRARPAKGIAFLAMERAAVVYFPAPLNRSFNTWSLIAAIVSCRT